MKVAFLDRDGVINDEVNYLHERNKLKYTYKCFSALRSIQRHGFELVIITNQAGIGKGIFTEEQYRDLTAYIISDLDLQGIKILEVMHCPHSLDANLEQYKVDCSFRKPNPGMINFILKKYPVNLEESFLVGDKISDIQAGMAAGIVNNYLVRSGHSLSNSDKQNFENYADLYELTTKLFP